MMIYSSHAIVGLTCLLTFSFSNLAAQSPQGKILTLNIVDLKGNPISGIKVALKTGVQSDTTTPIGTTQLVLPPATLSGSMVHLVLVPDKTKGKEWVFINPHDGKVCVPPFQNTAQNFVEIQLGKKSDPQIFESSSGYLALEKTTFDNIRNLTKEKPTKREHTIALDSTARAFGFSSKKIKEIYISSSDPGGISARYPEFYERFFYFGIGLGLANSSQDIEVEMSQDSTWVITSRSRGNSTIDLSLVLLLSQSEKGSFFQRIGFVISKSLLVFNSKDIAFADRFDYGFGIVYKPAGNIWTGLTNKVRL